MDATGIPLLLSLTGDIMFCIPPHLLSSPFICVDGGIGDGVCPQGSLDVRERRVFDVGSPPFLKKGDGYFCKGFALGLDYNGAEDMVTVPEIRAGEVINAGGA